MIGKEINGFHVVSKLGQGGMAEVYKAIDLKLEREVAIKFLRTNEDEAEIGRQRFEQEAKALAKLRHPNIVSVLGYGEYEGRPYLIMDYVSGGTLKEKMGKPMPWEKAAALLAPIAKALHYAHGKKIVHRDVKPSNILLDEDGTPMLSDFGVAKLLESEKSELTGTNVGVGTPHYMSPEQGRSQKVGPKSDIYSLGVVLYEMVTGRKPYEADTPLAVLLKHIEEPVPQPTKVARNLAEDSELVILKALSKDPKNRYADMAEMALVLEGGAAQPTPAGKPLPKYVLPLGAAAVLVLVVLYALQGRAQEGGPSAVDTEQANTSAPASATLPASAATPSPGNVQWPTDLSQIGFIASRGHGYSDLDIVFISANGSEFYSLFDVPGKNQVPSISQDGKKVAFISDRDGSNDIYVFELPTGTVKKLVDTPTTEWNPVWSPDGSKLAFVSDFAGSFDLYTVNADGTGMRQLTNDPLSDWGPDWSPDGRHIVFQREADGESANLFILTVDSGQVVALTADPASVFNSDAAWSPLGDKIAFASDINGNYDIFMISPDGTGREAISTNPNNENMPAWSPDGTQIVFSMAVGNNHELFVMNPDGSGLTRITNTSEMEIEPVWMVHAQPATVSQTLEIGSVYDDFNSGTAAQPFDPEKWRFWTGAGSSLSPNCDIAWEDGYLIFTHKPSSEILPGCGFLPAEFGRSVGRRTEVFESLMFMADDFEGDCCAFFGLNVNLDSGSSFPESGGWAECLLSADRFGIRMGFGVGAQNGDGLFSKEAPAEFNTWYRIRIEINPTDGKMSCYFDDQLVGEAPIQASVVGGGVYISWPHNGHATFKLDAVGFTP
ncbi:MAG: serine/threonine-protein kinase [Anaerolineales bacterium]|nr:serine/threonine-protein kinase [Anaerolineales bacterium]